MMNLSRLAYGDIERGKTDVTDSRLKQIAEVLGCYGHLQLLRENG